AERDLGMLLGTQRLDFLAPKGAALHHVRLVDRGHVPPPLGGKLERNLADPADFRRHIDLGIETAALPVWERFDAARLAEIDAADELAQDDEVNPARDLFAQWRGRREGRGRLHWTHIGEQLHLLA